MKENIKTFTVATLIFLCLLGFSGYVDGIFGELIYILAFLLPIILTSLSLRGERELFPLKLKPENSGLIALASPLFLFSVFLLSYVTAIVIHSATGAKNPSPVSGDPMTDILKLALAPAILEEALFRYLPLKLIAPYSKKSALLISSVFFALVHLSLFSIPYAALAGFLFMTADILSGSILPSVILHFLNNLISIIWEYSAKSGYGNLFVVIFALTALISFIAIFIFRKKYKALLFDRFERSDKPSLPRSTAALIIPTLIVATLDLFIR